MGSLIKLCVLIILIGVVGTSSDENNTSTEHRQARVNGYMNKVYSGTKADPIMCPKEGFLADPVDCSVFYRCIKSYNGKYTIYKFECAPGTVYDPDTEICNHARSTKRAECGGMQVYNDKNIGNDIEGSHELPSPITTNLPIILENKVTNLPTILENKVTKAEKTTIKYPSAINQIVSSAYYVPERSTTKNILASQQSTKINTYQPGNVITSSSSSAWTTTFSPRTTTSKDINLITNEQQGDECTKDGFMGDSQNCRKFYRCVNSNHKGFIRYEFLCSELTIWDDDLQSCNHPWAVRRRRCGRGEDSYQSVENNNSIPDKSVPQFSYGDKVIDTQKENKIDENQSHLDTGDNYNTNPVIGDHSYSQVTPSPTNNQQSPNSEIKKPQIQITYEPNIKKPQVINLYNKTFSGLTDKEYNDNKTQISLANHECSENGFIGDVHDCKKFYRCVGNGRGMFMKYEFTCSQGTVWDKNLDACNYVWAVKECGGKKKSENDIKHYSKETSIQYVTSSSEPATEIDLGYGSHFIDDHKKLTTTAALVPTNENYFNNECSSSGFFGDLHDCQIFYRCVENGKGKFIKYVYKCDKDTSWDPTTQTCNYIDKSIFACGKLVDSNKTSSSDKTFDKISTFSTIQFTTIPPVQNNIFESEYSKNLTHKPIYTHSSTKRSIDKNNICKASGFFGDSNDCKTFYRCVDDGNGNFIQHSFTCGEGTVWDANIEACNHAWAVDKCGGSKSTSKEIILHTSTASYSENEGNGYFTQNNQERPPSIQSTSTNLPTLYTTTSKSAKTTRSTNKNTNECTRSGFRADNYDCSKFYRCVDNGNGGYTQHEFTCGDGTVWDPKIEACNHKWAVEKCRGGKEENKDFVPTSSTEYSIMLSSQDTASSFSTLNIIKTTNNYQTTTLTAKDNVNINCKFDGFIKDENDCKRYYRCVKKTDGTYMQYEFSCGDGTVWDQEILACTHQTQNQKCGKRDVPSTSSTTYSTNDAKSPQDTPTLSTPSSSRPMIPIKSKFTDKNCTSVGFHADPSDCRKFYRCVESGNGDFTKYEFTCSDGTAWNREINACDYIYNTDCTNDYVISDKTPQLTTMSEVQQQISEKPEENEIPSSNNIYCKSEGFYANPKDCSKFYRCVSDGKGSYVQYDFSCGEGTVWIQESQVCDHDTGISNCITSTTTDNVSTSEHSTTTRFTTMKTTTTTVPKTTSEKQNVENNDNECKSEGFYPHKSDCKMFYRCVNEGNAKYTKYYYTCGEGTAWDTNLQVCNHINEVKRCEMQETSNHDTQTMPPLQDDQVYSDTNSNSDTTKAPSSSTTETTNSDNNTAKPIASSTASSKPVKKDNCEEEGYFGSSSNCKKFYRCVSNQNGGFTKYDFDCGEGTIWDQNIIGCNHPENVVNASCKSEDTNEVTTTLSSSSSASETSNNNESTSSTSSSQSSSSQSYTESNNESSTKPNNNNYTCTEAGFFADPNDCKKFYRCVDWDNNGERFSIFHFVCGDGTAWDQSLLTCNYEDAVNCSSTQQQSQNTTEENQTTTTETSTTESSTEKSTTTERSTTKSSTTQTPTTEKTTTQKPTTEETTTQTSTTQESTTQTSTTQKPTTTTSTTQKSTTQESTTQSTTTTTTEQSTTSSSSAQTTTEATTSSSTEPSTTSEASTQEQTSTTTDQTTTTTTEQMSSSTTQTTDQTTHADKTTTQSSTEEQQTTDHTESTTESTTETSSSSKECPETNEDEYLYVCPTSFRRHPKYCNLFYQCTEDEETHESKIATFHCPNNTIYDESKIQCVEEKEADKKCQGEIASRRRVKRLGVNYREPIIVGKNKMACQAPGHLLLESSEECSPAFLKCELSKRGNLRGFVYRCPEGYLYWSISRRCEASRKIKDCKRSSLDWSGRNEIPIEKLNVAP